MTEKIELLQINTDGGSRGNPGPAAIGVVAKNGDEVVFELSEKIGINTNNVAEYTAVIRSLETIRDQKIISEKIRYVLDSELIVRQITGKYKVKQPHLQTLRQDIVDLIKDLREKQFIHLMSFQSVRREYNKEADRLVNKALDS